ncbi:MAG: hypothetical protein ACRDTC_21990 [Pseudonocardiaceae bacterium]
MTHGERDSGHGRWKRWAVVCCTAGLLLALPGCGSTPEEADPPTVISYAAAADRLSGLDPAEAQEQLRDWIRTGLATALELDTTQLRNSLYDTVPVRDPAFVGLAEQPSGPGRALFDGRDTLHVLVPRDDPDEARTIGLLLDDHRTDAGADSALVQIHHYQIYPDAQTIELTVQDPAPTAEVRSANGYVETQVGDTTGLTDFLAQTNHLSLLEVRGPEIWAGGWTWPELTPGMAGARLSHEDVSVIQRGYLAVAAGRLPGFSLDPGPPETPGDALAILTDLSPELSSRLSTDAWEGSAFPSADAVRETVDNALFYDDPQPAALAELGLPTDRTQLYVLSKLFEGLPTYSQARYDGGLAGTEVGMTLFYTDFVAKNWINDVGTGVPTDAVGGFIPDPEAVIPWSHCPGPDDPLSEYGRLWFGPNESGFTFDDTRVGIGAQATRLFSRSDSDEGTEVEPTYGFGRGIRWWDQHYQQVADYEPQYQRLDQIMRWSAALEWLISRTDKELPQLSDTQIRSDLRFQDWYAQHSELRERSQIEFVAPPSAAQEAVLFKPSASYDSCGYRALSGGVSLSDLIQRQGDRTVRAELPAPVRRAGPVDPASTFDPQTGTGAITRLSIEENGQIADRLTRTFSSMPDGSARIAVDAGGTRVSQFGKLKIRRAETARRQIEVDLVADRGQVSQRVDFQGQDMGALVARKEADTVTVQWHSGWVDRFRRALEPLQDRLTSGSVTGEPLATDGVLYSYLDPTGVVQYKIGGQDSPWFSITKELRPPGEDLAFQFGGRNADTGLPEFFQVNFSAAPELQRAGRPAEWTDIRPATTELPAILLAADPPAARSATVPVTTPDGRLSGTIYEGDGGLRVRIDEPLLGLNGPDVGAALLRDSSRVAAAMADAAQAGDGLFRGVRLGGDGVAVAGADRVILASADHPWTARVLQSVDSRRLGRAPLLRIEGSRILHVDPSELTVFPAPERMSLGAALDRKDLDAYVHRSMVQFEDGVIVRDAVPRDTEVIVQVAEAADRENAHSPFWRPDIRVHEGAEWVRMTTGKGVGSGSNNATATATSVPVPDAPASGPPPNGQFLLICPADDADAVGCAQ